MIYPSCTFIGKVFLTTVVIGPTMHYLITEINNLEVDINFGYIRICFVVLVFITSSEKIYFNFNAPSHIMCGFVNFFILFY